MLIEFLRRYLTQGDAGGGGKTGEGAGDNKPDGTDNKLDLSKLTAEDIAKVLEGDIAKKLIQSELDRAVSKGIETFKTKTMPGELQKMMEEKNKKVDPQETVEQKRIRELEETVNNLVTQTKQATNKATAVELVAKKGLPNEILTILDYSDSERLSEQVETFAKLWSEKMEKTVEDEVAKRTGVAPKKGSESIDNPYEREGNPFKKETWNLSLQTKIFNENPELAETLKKQAK